MNVLLKTKELNSCIIRSLSKSCTQGLITPVQAQIIDYLIDNEHDIYQKNIEQLLNLRRSTISGILHTMEKNGLILKCSIKEDARLRKIILTQKARNLHDDINLKFDKLNERICTNITKKELSYFLNILDKMIDNIK